MGLPPEDEVTGWLARLNGGGDAPQPPAELRERILAAARNEPQQPLSPPKRGRPRAWPGLGDRFGGGSVDPGATAW